jgi:hypothetical protein
LSKAVKYAPYPIPYTLPLLVTRFECPRLVGSRDGAIPVGPVYPFPLGTSCTGKLRDYGNRLTRNIIQCTDNNHRCVSGAPGETQTPGLLIRSQWSKNAKCPIWRRLRTGNAILPSISCDHSCTQNRIMSNLYRLLHEFNPKSRFRLQQRDFEAPTSWSRTRFAHYVKLWNSATPKRLILNLLRTTYRGRLKPSEAKCACSCKIIYSV